MDSYSCCSNHWIWDKYMYRTVCEKIIYYISYVSTYFKILTVYKIFLNHCFHYKKILIKFFVYKQNKFKSSNLQAVLITFFKILISVASKKLLMIYIMQFYPPIILLWKNFHYTKTPKVQGYYYIFQKSRYIVINSKYLDTLYKGENKNPNVKPYCFAI